MYGNDGLTINFPKEYNVGPIGSNPSNIFDVTATRKV